MPSMNEGDSANTVIPPQIPLVQQVPPLPTTRRGEATKLDTHGKWLLYPAGKNVVVRNLDDFDSSATSDKDPSKGKVVVYRGHTGVVTVAKFSPNGEYIASGDMKGQIRIWAFTNPEHMTKMFLPNALLGPIYDISWSKVSNHITFVGDGGSSGSHSRVIQWDTAVQAGDTSGHTKRAVTAALRPKRPMRIVTGGEDQRCVIFSGPPFKRQGEMLEHSNTVNCVRYSDDGEYVMSVGSDKKAIIYDGKTGDVIKSHKDVHDRTIYACSWMKNHTDVVTCAADGSIKVIEALSGVIKTQVDFNNNSKTLPHQSSLFFTNKGNMIMGCCVVNKDDNNEGSSSESIVATAMNGLLIKVVNPTSDTNNATTTACSADVRIISGHQFAISNLCVDRVARVAYTSDLEGVICKWLITENQMIPKRFTGGSAEPNSGTIASVQGSYISALDLIKAEDGKSSSILMSCGFDDNARLSSTMSLETSSDNESVSLGSQPVASCAASKYLFVLTSKGITTLDGKGKVVSAMVSETLNGKSISCHGNRDHIICVGTEDSSIYVYSFDEYGVIAPEPIKVFSCAHRNKPVSALSISPDGKYLASADSKDIFIWDIVDSFASVVQGRWCFHTSTITTLDWSPSNILASGGVDDNIFLWALKRKSIRVHYPRVHCGGVNGVKFLDDHTLLTVGSDGCLCRIHVGQDIENNLI